MKATKEKDSISKRTLDLLPIRYYDESLDAFVLEDGTYLDIYEKVADDVDNMMEDDVQMLMMRFAKFLKLYKDDLKIISLNFPTNTLMQQKNLMKKQKETTDPIRKKWIERSISELTRAEAGTRKREYYFLIISKDQEEHYNHVKQLSILGDGARMLSFEKKLKIIYKLNNMNSLIPKGDIVR